MVVHSGMQSIHLTLVFPSFRFGMQIVENFGTHVSSKSENMQVTLNNAAEILAVFPELSLNAEEIPMEYDYKTSQHVQLTNQVIIKKCASPTVSLNYD